MVTKRANVEYTDQPYFSKAAQRPQPMPTANTAAKQERVTNGPWGKARTDYKTNNGPVRSARSTDEIFSDSYAQAGMQPAKLNQAPDQPRKANVLYNTEQRAKQLVRSGGAYGVKKLRNQKKLTKVIGVQRLKVSTANAWIGSWAAFWYLSFQLPLALISTAGLGIVFTVYTSIKNGPLGFALPAIEGFVNFTSNYLGAAIQWALSLYGINFNPMLLFITPFALVFLLGLFQLVLTWFVYSAMRINSLSGKAGGLKGLMFVLAGVGYAIPMLNLFPLIFLWMAVVWIHPK